MTCDIFECFRAIVQQFQKKCCAGTLQYVARVCATFNVCTTVYGSWGSTWSVLLAGCFSFSIVFLALPCLHQKKERHKGLPIPFAGNRSIGALHFHKSGLNCSFVRIVVFAYSDIVCCFYSVRCEFEFEDEHKVNNNLF